MSIEMDSKYVWLHDELYKVIYDNNGVILEIATELGFKDKLGLQYTCINTNDMQFASEDEIKSLKLEQL